MACLFFVSALTLGLILIDPYLPSKKKKKKDDMDRNLVREEEIIADYNSVT